MWGGGGGGGIHVEGGAHTRQSMATARVFFFKGGAGASPRIERSEPSIKRSKPRQRKVWRPTHKAVHTQGGVWPLQESCYLR